MTRTSKLLFVIGPIIALTSMAGCAGKIHYSRYYLLNVPPPISANDQAAKKVSVCSVAVREFAAPGFLKEGAIAYRPSPERLDFYDYHRWAEDPRRVVTTTMVRELRARGLFRSVEAFDGRSSECLLTGTLDHLEEVDHGADVSIEVSLSARLVNLRTGELLWNDSISKTTPVSQHSVSGIVVEMSNDLGRVIEGLVSSMESHVSPAPTSFEPTRRDVAADKTVKEN